MKKAARLSVLSGAALLALALAACSSGTTPNSDPSKDGGGTVDVSVYQKAAEEAMKPVEAFTGPTTGPKAKAGVRVMHIACGFAADGCKGPADAAVEAGETLDWDVTVVDGQFDPQIYNRAISQAIDQNYDAIMLGSITDSAVAENLKRAREAGIFVGSWDGANVASDTGVTFEVEQPLEQQGINVANYLIWKADGKLNAQVLLNPEFKVVSTWSEAAIKVIEDCATCSVSRQDNFTGNDAATRLPTLVTQALRENPEINAVLGGYDAALISTVPALEAADLSDQVMLAGWNGIPAYIEYIRDGRATVTSGAPIKWGIWAAFDNFNRLVQGEKIVDQNMPVRLIVAENVDEIADGSGWEGDVDYKSAFKKIWNGEGE